MALVKIRNADNDGWVTIGGGVEVVQQDAEPTSTYAGMLWLDTDADPLALTTATYYKHNLIVKAGTTGASEVTVTADELAATDSNLNTIVLSSVSVTDIDITASGAGGLDTGAESTGTWYYIWIIYNGSTVSGLLSASSTAPTMPSGYTYKRLVGEIYNDASGNFKEIWRADDVVEFEYQTLVFDSWTATSIWAAITIPAPMHVDATWFRFRNTGDATSRPPSFVLSSVNDTNYSFAYHQTSYPGNAAFWSDLETGEYHPHDLYVPNVGGTLSWFRRSSYPGGTYAGMNCYIKGYILPR